MITQLPLAFRLWILMLFDENTLTMLARSCTRLARYKQIWSLSAMPFAKTASSRPSKSNSLSRTVPAMHTEYVKHTIEDTIENVCIINVCLHSEFSRVFSLDVTFDNVFSDFHDNHIVVTVNMTFLQVYADFLCQSRCVY